MSELAVDMTERLLPTERAAPSAGAWTSASASDASPAVVMQPASAGDGRTRSLQLAAWLVSLSSFMWGFGAGVLNVCIVPDAVGSLLVDINLTTAEQETATALVVVGAMASAVSTGGVGGRIGLKRTILLNNAFFVAGGVVCALATSKRSIFVGRFLIGIASGIVTNTVPILLNEISPVRARGQITSLHQLSLTIGNLFVGLLGYYLVTRVPSGWRWLNAFMIVPPVLQCLLVAWIPESPWWLMKNYGREETHKVLRYLRAGAHKGAIEEELQDIAQVMEHRRHEKQVTWSHLLAHKEVVVMGAVLVFFQAMTGINTVMLYSAKIFHFAGVTDPFLATTIVGAVNVGVTVVSVKLVDSYGRRPLLLFGTVTMIVALVVLSWSLLYLNSNLKLQGAIAVVSVLFFVGGFAIGLGAVVWVILGDITPVHIRTRAFSFYMGVSYICNIVIAVYTLSAINFLGRGTNPEKNGIAKLYLILSSVSVAALVYIFAGVGETSHIKTAPSKARVSGEGNGLLSGDGDDDTGEVTEL